ncbi:peptide/nickel transport system substrate-binding protein [Breoghania corrubedonensis]|uniref:Peptide/nickel transport system substrate-binding protein n=1 Tax=Breoghania corrubedonensis TaxID=665038 RepID=A0A2T5US89_9HYPH|nr:ABC transporter substrate-binding protein [Breoghania corrubedonensis]PTW54368.1 peptide/nickel transport system substrate-binding protein [Breoghania corrubedonensis]
MNNYIKHLAEYAASGRLSRRAFLGRASALGFGAVAANSLLGRAVQAAGPVKGGTLKMGLAAGQSTDSLDPALAANTVTFQVQRTWGEALLEVNPDGTLLPRLAESFGSSKDAKTWTFKIRKGVEFHNGKTLSADDVRETLLRHSDADSKSGALGVMRGIDAIKVDGDEVIVTLKDANADLPYLMSDFHLMIQPGGGREDPTAAIGTNAYKLVDHEAGVRYAFERNPNYWDAERGHFETIEMAVINDDTARNSTLQSGQVHIVNRVSPKVAGLLARAPGISVEHVAGRGHYVFIMQCDAAPFESRELRNALKYAVNREEMVDKILRGYGSVGNDFPINKTYPLFDESIPQRTYDPEKAAELYKKSGHDGSPIVLRVADAAFPGAIDAAQLFQQSAKAAGIPLQIKREPDDGYWSDVWNKKPFCASYWDGRPVQDQMYSTAYLSSADWNDTHFKNEKFDKMLFQAKGELDQDKRKKLYSEMAYLVRDEGGLICPMFNDFIEGVSDKVQGWEKNGVLQLMNGLVPVKCWFG